MQPRPPTQFSATAGFTLVEVLIAASLSLIVVGAVLSSYVFLGRNFTRSMGMSGANQPSLEAGSRQTLTAFGQDVRIASGISGTPSANAVDLIQPTATGTKTISYYYNSTGTPAVVTLSGYSTTVPGNSLVRVDGSTGATKTLLGNLLSLTFTYYDGSGNPYTTFTNYLSGIKQLSVSFSAQGGSSTNQTLTQIYQTASPRLILRNKDLLR